MAAWLAGWYLFECILKILKLDNCIAVVVPVVVPVIVVVVMVHDPVAKVWRAYANCGKKTVKISMVYLVWGYKDLWRPWLAALTAKQFAEISLKLNEIVKSISHILTLSPSPSLCHKKWKDENTKKKFPPYIYLEGITNLSSRLGFLHLSGLLNWLSSPKWL